MINRDKNLKIQTFLKIHKDLLIIAKARLIVNHRRSKDKTRLKMKRTLMILILPKYLTSLQMTTSPPVVNHHHNPNTLPINSI